MEGPVKAMQMLNVYCCDTGMCLCQKPIEEKTNEIPAAQELPGLMDLKGMIVTMDAMNCQKDTAAVIHEGKGDYVLAKLGMVKESYKMSMKRIRYELSLDYENGVEKMLSMLDVESIREALGSKRISPIK